MDRPHLSSRAPPSSQIPWLELLPRGRLLPDHLWQRRHRAITILLWLNVPALAVFGLARGMGLHVLLDVAVLAGFALVAGSRWPSRTVRSIAGSVGLVTSSAVLVHVWGGTIEAHFAFFVVVSILMLYQDWVPFLIAIAFVIVHHGIVGALAPTSVYAHDTAYGNPWKWALIHGAFVIAAATANLVSWRANEQLLHDPLTGLATRLRAARPDPDGARAGPRPRHGGRGAVHRPRPLQGAQRLARPRDRRSRPARARGPAPGRQPRHRHSPCASAATSS